MQTPRSRPGSASRRLPPLEPSSGTDVIAAASGGSGATGAENGLAATLAAVGASLAAVGPAIEEEVQRKVSVFIVELEHERKLRQLLEQQVAKLQQAVYTNTEVDQQLEALTKRMEDSVLHAKEESEKALRAAQRELEHQIHTVQTQEPEPAKPKTSVEDVLLLSNEMDRKLGTVLMDIDRKLGAMQPEAVAAAKAAVKKTADDSSAEHSKLCSTVDELRTSLESGIDALRGKMDMFSGTETRIDAKLNALQTSLEQKIGMVQLEVDQVRAVSERHS